MLKTSRDTMIIWSIKSKSSHSNMLRILTKRKIKLRPVVLRLYKRQSRSIWELTKEYWITRCSLREPKKLIPTAFSWTWKMPKTLALLEKCSVRLLNALRPSMSLENSGRTVNLVRRMRLIQIIRLNKRTTVWNKFNLDTHNLNHYN